MRKKQIGGPFKGFSNEMLKSAKKSADKSRINTGLASVDKAMPTEEEMNVKNAQKIVANKKEITRRKDAIWKANAPAGLKDDIRNIAIEEKMRAFPNDPESFIDDYLNPLRLLGSMADKIGHADNLNDLGKSLVAPIMTGAFAGIGTNTTGQFVNNIANPLAGLGPRIANSPLPNITIGMLKNKQYSELANLYKTVGGAELAPIIKHIPGLNKMYKDLAYKYASGSGGAPSLTFFNMKNIKNNKFRNNYSGNNAMVKMVDGEYPEGYRDLLKEYIYGNQPGFKLSNEIPEGLEAYQKRYGNMKVYEMQSKVGNGNPIPYISEPFEPSLHNVLKRSNININKLKGKSSRFSFDDAQTINPIFPLDDVAGHQGWIDNTSGKPELVSQDIWKFTPEDYISKWGNKRRKSMNTGDYLKYKQAILMDNAGKPFITMSRNPVHLNTTSVERPMSIKDMVTPLTPTEIALMKLKGIKKNQAVLPTPPPSYNTLSGLDDIVYKKGGISKMGYRDDSPYRGRKKILIKGNGLIDMSNTGIPLKLEDEMGNIKYVNPYSGMHQMIGNVMETPMQKGGLWNTNQNMYADSVLNANKNLNFVQRYQHPNNYPVINNPDGSHSTHLMAYDNNRVYPTIIQDKSGKLINFGNNDNAWNYADSTKEYIEFPNQEQAKWFASNGYKKGKQFQKGGLTKKQIFNFLFDEEDKPTVVADTQVQEPEDEVQTQVPFSVEYEEIDLEQENSPVSRYRQRKLRERNGLLPTGFNMNPQQSQPVTASYNTSQEDRGTYAYNYLLNKGIPNHAAAGIIGNFEQESGDFREDVIAGTMKGDSGLATGIAQWHPDRWNAAVQYSKRNGKNPYTLEAQLDFALHEADQRGDLQRTINTSNSQEAANVFAKYYERPKIIDPNRAKYAQRYHKRWGGEIYNELFKTK